MKFSFFLSVLFFVTSGFPLNERRRLQMGERFNQGDVLVSPNKEFYAVMQ